MILKIALAVALAVIVSAYWEALCGLGLMFLSVGVMLVGAGLLMLWTLNGSAAYAIVGSNIAVIGGIFLIVWIARYLSNMRAGSRSKDAK